MIVTMILGAPASGKSTATSKLKNDSVILNRDTEGGKIIDLIPKLESLLIKNTSDVLLDNLFPDIQTRKPFIDLCKKYKVPINCIWLKTSIEDCQFNAVIRAIKITNEFPSPEIIKKK
jgi:predicted kinase